MPAIKVPYKNQFIVFKPWQDCKLNTSRKSIHYREAWVKDQYVTNNNIKVIITQFLNFDNNNSTYIEFEGLWSSQLILHFMKIYPPPYGNLTMQEAKDKMDLFLTKYIKLMSFV